MRIHLSALTGLLMMTQLAACKPEEVAVEKPRPVRTQIVAPTADEEVILQTGEIRPRYETSLGFRIDGRLATRLVDVGTRVKAGQVIGTLDDRDVLNEQRAAEADLRSAKAAEDIAKVTLERQRALFDKEIVAKARVDEAEVNWQSARSRREAADATLANVRNKMSYTKMVAEADGIITSVGANTGQVVAAGQMVATLASTGELEAEFAVAEELIQRAPSNPVVKVSLLTNPGVSVLGPVREVSPTADPVTRTFRVRISLPGAPSEMAFGSTVTGSLALSRAMSATVPSSAITNDGDMPAVFVVDTKNGVLVRKPVTVARYAAGTAQIAAGLEPGDAVVTAGVAKLRPGQKVLVEVTR